MDSMWSAGVCGEWDVVVAGGGPAGCTAAVAAAEEGRKVLLIEATGALGGMGTMGMIPAWCPFSDGEKIVYQGLAEKVFRASNKGCKHVKPGDVNWVPINVEHLKAVYDRMIEKAGVTVLFFSTVAGARVEGSVVREILIANKNGISTVKAGVFIDCTGDGDVCSFAGAESQKGDSKGEMQPTTHCFSMSGVNLYHYSNGSRPSSGVMRNHGVCEKYPLMGDLHLCNNITDSVTIGFNAGHLWGVDGSDAWSLSGSMIEGRKIAAQYCQALQEVYPDAFGGAQLAATAPLMGIRETRRIVGDYMLTIGDYLERKSFDDDVCRNCYPIDIHTAKNEINDALDNKIHAMDRYERYGKGESHGIPYRCLQPKGLDNVLVAGRCISTDRDVQASTRVMPVALAMGEAAGVAAAMAFADSGKTRNVDVSKLRSRLSERGAYIG